jgi:chromodomain-containing protein
VESILQARCKTPGDPIEYKVHWKGYPSADDSWVPHEDLHSPDLLKEFYAQGGKVQAVKRRREQLRRLILSLSCLPPATTPATSPLTTKSCPPLQTKEPSNKYNERRCIPRTSYEPSQCLTRATRPMTVTRNEKGVDNFCVSQYKCSATTAKREMQPRTSSIPLPGRFVVASLSLARTTKPCRLQEGRSFMELYKFSGTTPISIPSTTQANPPAARRRRTSTNCSSSAIQRYPFKSLTFSAR